MNLHSKDIKIFAGNSNPELASRMAKRLGVPVGQCKVGAYPDGEISVAINDSVRGSDVFVVQSTCAPVNDHLMELLILIDAFKRASAGRITAVIPYFGYARQDRKSKAHDPISAKLVADLITTAGAHRVLTIDLHAPQIQGFFNIPVDHLLGVPILAPYFAEHLAHKGDLVVVAPHLGSVRRARKFAEKLDAPLAIIDRRQQNGATVAVNIVGDVKGKRAILVDDLVNTGATLLDAARALTGQGQAAEVYACATHGVLSGAAIQAIENSPLRQLVLLDTVPLGQRRSEKIVTLDAAPVFAEAIERIYEDKPISPMVY